jgi:hypothetical protein
VGLSIARVVQFKFDAQFRPVALAVSNFSDEKIQDYKPNKISLAESSCHSLAVTMSSRKATFFLCGANARTAENGVYSDPSCCQWIVRTL